MEAPNLAAVCLASEEEGANSALWCDKDPSGELGIKQVEVDDPDVHQVVRVGEAKTLDLVVEVSKPWSAFRLGNHRGVWACPYRSEVPEEAAWVSQIDYVGRSGDDLPDHLEEQTTQIFI